MHQMSALDTATRNRPAPPVHPPFNVPPITQFSIPAIGAMQTGGGRRRATVPPEDGRAEGDVVHPLHLQITPHGRPVVESPVLYQGAYPHLLEEGEAEPRGTLHSNIMKQFANMNACFSCSFEVEDGHTSKTCPREW
jgi:hypothetical protein